MSFKIRSISELLRFSGNRHLDREGKKSPMFQKNVYISKKQAELNELRQTVLLKHLTLDILLHF